MSRTIRPRIDLLAAGLACTLLAAAPAWSSDPSAPQAEPPAETEFVEYVEVGAESVPGSNTVARKMAVAADRTPVHVGQIGRGLIEDQDARFLGDSLRNVAGLHTVPFNGTFDYFLVRGFDALSSGAVLTDGAQEPEASFFRSYNIQGVEVLKGPSGFLFGANPLAGVVNVVRKQPVPSNFGTVRLSAGSWGEALGELDWNHAVSADGSFRLNGMWTEGDGWRDRTGFEHRAINPAFSWTPGDRTRVNVNAEFATSEYGPDAGIPLVANELPDVDRETSYQSPFDRSEQDVTRFQIDVEHDLPSGVTLRNKTYYRRLEWLSDGTIFNGVFPNPVTFEPEVNRLFLSLDDDQQFVGNQFEAVFEVTTGAVRHQVLVGVEVARREDTYTLLGSCPAGAPGCEFFTVLPNLSVLDPVETATARPDLLPFGAIDPNTPGAGDNRADIVAPYVVDQIRFSEAFELLLGVRYDDIAFDDAVTGASRDDADASPMVGFVYRPVASTTVFGNAGTSFAPAGPRVPGTPDPEETEQVEIGVRRSFAEGRGRGTLSAYRLDRSNIAILDSNGFSQQVGDQRSQGVELELALQPVPRTRIVLAYAWTDAELTRFTEGGIVGFDPVTFEPIFGVLDRSGNAPAFVPEHLGSVWASRSLGAGFEVGGGVRYLGSQYIDEDNAYEIDAATLVDLGASWTRGDWKLRLNLKNVTDEEYETRGFGAASVTPGLPFAVTGGVEYRF